MSREIKFRAWNVDYMAYQGTPDLETLQSFIFHYGDKELMQYTGLKDKKGKEIYEGDIIELPNGDTCEVVWSNENLGFEGNVIKSQYGFQKYSYISAEKLLGNKYQNPELLRAVAV